MKEITNYKMRAFLKFCINALSAFILVILIIVYGLSFRIDGYRPHRQLNDDQKREILHLLALNENKIKATALDFTATNLDFSTRKNSETDPNIIINEQHAHCVMYAYVFSSSYNYLADVRKIDYRCEVATGRFYLFGINIHQFIQDSFFANHDVCVIRVVGSEPQVVDPVLFDYFGELWVNLIYR